MDTGVLCKMTKTEKRVKKDLLRVNILTDINKANRLLDNIIKVIKNG